MNTEEFHRKITAILNADVQGYSRLMGEDEESTVRTLTAYRTLMSSLIRDHRGHVVDTPGDNLLAKFDSGTDAVRCAVEIQEELRIRNADLPENRRMLFRIGINLGDVIEEGDRIYGDGINVAARIEGLAEGGGICISGIVYDAIRNKLSLSYEFMGEHSVKNIKDPVRVYRIRMEPDAAAPIVKKKAAKARTWQRVIFPVLVIFILGIVAICYFSFRQSPVVSDVGEPPKTIAVLPFADLSPEKDQEYFVDGLSEEILNSLAQISDLTVIARTSSFSFKGTTKKIQEIASELGVAHILEGSVRKSGDALRITAQLVKGTDGSHIWSKTYDRELKDIFEIQEDIATAVADELKVTLGIGGSLRQLGGTDNENAYELYLIASGQFWAYDAERALVSINEAIVLDHDFALAWALKSEIQGGLVNLMPYDQYALLVNESVNSAQKSIELEPELATGYYALGKAKAGEFKWAEAQLAFNKALEFLTDPSLRYEMEFPYYYMAVGHLGRAKLISEGQIRNDPLNSVFRLTYSSCLALMGEYQKAEEEFQKCKMLFEYLPDYAEATIDYARLGNNKVESDEDLQHSSLIFDAAKVYLKLPKDGLQELNRIYKNDNNLSVSDITDMCLWAAYFGDPEFAMDVIENADIQRDDFIYHLWLPVYHEVRQLPRFKEFVRELGLVDYWEQFRYPDLCHPTDDSDFVCD